LFPVVDYAYSIRYYALVVNPYLKNEPTTQNAPNVMQPIDSDTK